MFCPQDPIRETAEQTECFHEFLTAGDRLPTIREVLEWVSEEYPPEAVYSDDDCREWADRNDYIPDVSVIPHYR